ncbi:MAG: ACP S-malonyltransferase [Candidatus Bipolaricaulaceae bacterium]
MVAFLFPGQGAQSAGMGADLFAHPAGQEVLAQARALGWERPVPELSEEELARTAVVQPALFLVEWAAFLVLQERAEPGAVAGHSLGEFAALAAAGVLAWPEAFRLVRLRGELMEEAAQAHPGGMVAALGLPPAEVERIAQETGCFVANYNGPTQVVLAGGEESLAWAEARIRERGGKAVRLGVAGAFHSPFMAEAARRFAQALDETPFRLPRRHFVSSATGSVESHPERIREILKGQMVQPVRWQAAVETLAALGVAEAWEAGPGEVLTRLGRRITERIRFRTLKEVWAHV